ncbi:MAG: putative permease [Rhodobacteraceae bacterium HLUCCA08]|nr:MAG: putative permease [Rhodobacteraceae bacterium HLUCCA08]
MIAAAITIWSIVATLALVVFRRQGRSGLAAAGTAAIDQGRALMIRLPLALLAASFLMQVLPVDALVGVIGPQSGLAGIAVAALIGGILPGGPMTSFPIALVILQGGAGLPQIVALITGWSVFALHRVLAYEAPIMGWRFVALRLAASLVLPLAAGLMAQALLPLVP